MELRTLAIAALLGVSGCGGDGGEDGESLKCSAASGTYYVDYELLSGDCGDEPDGLVQLTSEPDPTCTVLSGPTTSDGGCKVELSEECPYAAGLSVRTTSELTQQENGETITGTVTFTAYQDGTPTCTGSYRVTYTKQ